MNRWSNEPPVSAAAKKQGKLGWMVVAVLCVMGSSGCGQEASLQRESPTGGLVTFPVQSESDILSSQGRRDALRLMQEKCPSGSRIIKEGELPKVSKAADRAWGQQIGSDRIWGIQFTCK